LPFEWKLTEDGIKTIKVSMRQYLIRSFVNTVLYVPRADYSNLWLRMPYYLQCGDYTDKGANSEFVG
jgi:hypothetical protein